MLHVLTTLLATALLASTTGANVVKNYKTHEGQNKTAFRAEPKRAYYDPDNTYGNTVGTFYNYTSTTLSTQYTENANLETITFNTSGDGSPTEVYFTSYPSTSENYQSNIALIKSTYDFYKNGVLQDPNTITIGYVPRGTYWLKFNIPKAEDYWWVFDHEETDPIEEMNGNIFDAVGDTITGLSNALATPWEGILNIFYDTTDNEVTQMGYLVLIGLGVSITLLVFWTILRLFKQRN